MQRRNAALLLMGLAVPMIMGDSRHHSGVEAQSGATLSRAAAHYAMPAGSAGQILSLDPATGKIRTAPAQIAGLREVLGDAISTSSEGLVEEKSPVAGGGILLHLQGRFQNAETAVLDADGKLIVPCVSGSPQDAQSSAAGEVE